MTTDDHDERLLLQALAREAYRQHDLLQQKLAYHIINTLSKAMRR